MALKILYQSKEKSRNSQETTFKVTYYGTETQVDNYSVTLFIGITQVDGLYLTSWRKSQLGGNIWQIECEYHEQSSDFGISTLPPSEIGVKSAQLSIRNLQLPLERLNGYKQRWNHYLIQKASVGETLVTPSWWLNAGYEDFIPVVDRETYKWVDNLAEIPQEPTEDGKYWQIVKRPSKPGVQYFDYAYFVVQEKMKFGSASDAGVAIAKNINKIVAPSNTFGISGGDWKLDSAEIFFTGSYWQASNTYTHSPSGWSDDLYGTNASILPDSSSSSSNNNNSL